MDKVRKEALRILAKCESAGQYSNLALDSAIRHGEFGTADRALLTALVYGVTEKKLTLDYCADRLCARPQDVEPDVRDVLRLGLYQLAFLRIPDHAAVNETVSLAPKHAKGFVNAILRAFLRAGKELPAPDRNADPTGYLSVRYSVCAGLAEKLTSVYGFERTESILSALSLPPPVTVRVNTLRSTRDALIADFRAAGAEAEPGRHAPHAILTRGIPVTALPGFDAGNFFVQDEASQCAVEALGAAPGMKIVDVCACPGSKSFGAAMDMNGTGEIYARDLHANKLSLVTGGAGRLGIGCIRTGAGDAREPDASLSGKIDRVICDVPCSGFGVLGKKPELRYKDPAESAALPGIQYEILSASATYLRAGGRMVYSTCTILPEENGEVVARFLAEHPEFCCPLSRTMFPDTDGTDGFYYAVLEKKTGETEEKTDDR